MKRIATFGLAVVLMAAFVAVSAPDNANAQSAGLISSIVNRMERNRRDMKSMRAAISMVKRNAQIGDEDKYSGTVLYVPAAGRNAFVRVDWQSPQRETLAVANGRYTLCRPRLNMCYVGSANAKTPRANGAFDFLNMSSSQLSTRFEPLQYLGEETIWGGIATSHIKLVPKGNASYKYAEVWVDGSGLPVQTKVVEKNDDSTTVRLLNVERNANISLDQFDLKPGDNVKIVKG